MSDTITFSVKVVPMYDNGRAKDYYFVEWSDTKGLNMGREDKLINSIFEDMPEVYEAGISIKGDYANGRYDFPTVKFIDRFAWYQMQKPYPNLFAGEYSIIGAVFKRLDLAEKYKIELEKKVLFTLLSKENL
jgi:hypothetical protein